MSDEQRKDVIAALVKFIVHVTDKSATPEELAALPKVAEVLSRWDCQSANQRRSAKINVDKLVDGLREASETIGQQWAARERLPIER